MCLCGCVCVCVSVLSHGSREVDGHERVGGQEEVDQSAGLVQSPHHVAKPGDEPAEAEVVGTLRSDDRKRKRVE